MPAANTTLYAKWVLNETRYVIFNNNGGSGTMSNQGIVEGNSANLTANTFTRTGYAFIGWALSEDGEVIYEDEASITMGASNINLYAQWTINGFTVTFDSNGGSAISSQTIEYGGKVTKPTNPTRTGYTFSTWVRGSAVWDFNNHTVTENMTLDAVWAEIKITSISLSPQGSTTEAGRTVNFALKSLNANNLTATITVNSVTPSAALNKTLELIIESGSSLIDTYTASITYPSQTAFTIKINLGASGGDILFKIRSAASTPVTYYYKIVVYRAT
jgi:uncharacterized repeat protein (TIGR02543 family)